MTKNDQLRKLRDELQADYNRPEGRWGIHGHSCVDDDYFVALDYVINRIDQILAENKPLDTNHYKD